MEKIEAFKSDDGSLHEVRADAILCDVLLMIDHALPSRVDIDLFNGERVKFSYLFRDRKVRARVLEILSYAKQNGL